MKEIKRKEGSKEGRKEERKQRMEEGEGKKKSTGINHEEYSKEGRNKLVREGDKRGKEIRKEGMKGGRRKKTKGNKDRRI